MQENLLRLIKCLLTVFECELAVRTVKNILAILKGPFLPENQHMSRLIFNGFWCIGKAKRNYSHARKRFHQRGG
jgi:hypothetical protein